MAVDLRYVVAVMKMNNDLERIGDLAVDISERAIYLAGTPSRVCAGHPKIADTAQLMLKNSLDAMVNSDTALRAPRQGGG